MGRAGSWFCLLGGSLGLLGHALLDVVHGEGDGLGRGKGERGERASVCARPNRLGSSQVARGIRVDKRVFKTGDGRVGTFGSSVVSKARSTTVGETINK